MASSKRRGRNPLQFLDIQADVDSGDDDATDLDSTDFENDAYNHLESEPLPSSYGDLDQRSPQQEAEELARQAKYFQVQNSFSDSNHSPASFAYDMFESISKSLNSRLWRVSVKRGFERVVQDFLSRKAEGAKNQGISSVFGAAFSCSSIPGVVYIECEDPQEIRRLLHPVHTVYTTQPVSLVSPEERVQLENMRTVENPLSEGTWVRIKRGTYKGDIGHVVGVNSNTTKVDLLLVPRVYYQDGPVWTRPSQDLFRVELARTIFGEDKVVQLAHDSFLFQEERFEGGLLARSIDRGELEAEPAFPLLEELELFGQSSHWDARARRKWESDVVAAALRVGDRVEITEGELEGTVGRITRSDNDSIEVQPLSHPLGQHSFDEHFRIGVLSSQVRRIFKIGDYIQVRCGNHAGKCGYIVDLSTDRTLEFVEWDKSVPHEPVYEPDSRPHLMVYAFSVDFAEEHICLADCPDDLYRPHVSKGFREDPMVGTRVVLIKSAHFHGYRGTIQYTHKTLKLFGVRLDAMGKTVQISEHFLVDMSTGFRVRFPIHRKFLEPNQDHNCNVPCPIQPSEIASPPSPRCQTPMSELPLIPTTPAREPGPLSEQLENDCFDSREHYLQEDNATAADRCQSYLPSGVEEGWLASDIFHSKSVKVRLSGPDANYKCYSVPTQKDIQVPKGSLAFTTGQPASVKSKSIEVRAITPGSQPMLAPLQYLAPVKPRRPEGRVIIVAVIVAGGHFGKEVLVMGPGGEEAEWKVLLLDGSRSIVRLSPDHLVELRKSPL